jgi:hypothetical protein
MCQILVHVGVGFSLPDITDAEKSQIREIAKQYAVSIWRIPFNEGLILYVKTNEKLNIHPARWKFCLKCGDILKSKTQKDLKEGEELEKHKCLLDVHDFPVLIKTSWYKLKEFFLTDTYKEFMKEAGIDRFPSLTLVTKISKETKESEQTKIPATEEERV